MSEEERVMKRISKILSELEPEAAASVGPDRSQTPTTLARPRKIHAPEPTAGPRHRSSSP